MSRCLLWAAIALGAVAPAAAAGSNLRAPLGRRSVDFDAKSLKIGERRVLLRAGAVHYFRIPPEEWRHRLVQTRLAGFNAIETPVPWNLHEPTKGRFVFRGAADLGRFLDQCHDAGLMALVRVGPYVNAAVTNGGLPAWLGDEPRLLVRSRDTRFIDAVRSYWAKMLPLVAQRQAPRGAVALVQVEDHYRGTERGYLPKLLDELGSFDLRVPIVLSELNPCTDFQRLRPSDDTVLATTELLPAGPLAWGQPLRDFRHFDDIVLEGIAKGIDGYNHALWAAGTHFALLPASSFPTRFEAGTCGLLEGGGLSRVFHQVKRANLFAGTFEPVLAAARAAGANPLLDKLRRLGMVAYARTDGTTTVVLAKPRYGSRALDVDLPDTGVSASLPVDPNVFRHIVLDHPLTPGTRLFASLAQVLTIQKLGGRTVLVVYAPAGSDALMLFATKDKPRLLAGAKAFAWDPQRKLLALTWRPGQSRGPADFLFKADQRIHVVALEEKRVDHTWLLPGAGILTGVPAIADWSARPAVRVDLALPARRGRYSVAFYPTGDAKGVGKTPGLSDVAHDPTIGRIDFRLALDANRPSPLMLRRWEAAPATAEAASAFDDGAWTESRHPEPLGQAAYGWYRCRFNARRAGRGKLLFENVADSITVYLNGKCLGQSATKRLVDAPRSFRHPATFDVDLAQGPNLLAVLVKSWGRYSNAGTFGKPLAAASGWGLLGKVLLDGRPLSHWRRREGLSPTTQPLRWGKLPEGTGPVRWYRTSFKLRKSPARQVPRAVLKGLSYGSAWLNGRFIGLYQQRGYDSGRGLYLAPPWLKPQNTITVLEESGREPQDAEVRFDSHASLIPLRITFQ